MSTPAAPEPRRLWLRVLLTVLICLLGLILTIVLVVSVFLSRIGRPDPNQTYFTPEELQQQEALDLRDAVADHGPEQNVVYPELDPSEIQWSAPNQVLGHVSQDVINILLIGQDRREGETRARSDSMILVTFNRTTGAIVLTSFLRDLYVQIPDYDPNRLNAAYAFGGMKLLDKTLEETFGVEIDANIEVDFSGFSDIIDTLGGVDITLTSAEADYLGLTQGLNHMDGQEALAYSRIRYLDSDFSRTGRQRKVLTALFQQVQQMSLTECLSLANEIFPLLTTDMTNLKVISLATELFPMLPGASLQTLCIPAQGTYSFNNVDGMDVIIADFAANQDLLAETLAPESGE